MSDTNSTALTTLKREADKAIAGHFAVIGKSGTAMVEIGRLMGRAMVDGVYPAKADDAAKYVQSMRPGAYESAKAEATAYSQIKNFALMVEYWPSDAGVILIERATKLCGANYKTTALMLGKVRKAFKDAKTRPASPPSDDDLRALVAKAEKADSAAIDAGKISALMIAFCEAWPNYDHAMTKAWALVDPIVTAAKAETTEPPKKGTREAMLARLSS